MGSEQLTEKEGEHERLKGLYDAFKGMYTDCITKIEALPANGEKSEGWLLAKATAFNECAELVGLQLSYLSFKG